MFFVVRVLDAYFVVRVLDAYHVKLLFGGVFIVAHGTANLLLIKLLGLMLMTISNLSDADLFIVILCNKSLQ